MTEQSAPSRFSGHTFLALGAGVGAAVVAGLVCRSLHIPQPMQGSLTGGAVGVPAAIEYHLQGRRRNRCEEIARIQRDELRRPLGIVIPMFAGALLAFEQLGLFSGGGWSFLLVFSLGVLGDFFTASYASHYLGDHPYRWTVVTVACSYLAQLVLLSMSRNVKIYENVYMRGAAHLIATEVALGLGWLVTLGVCLAGVWHGRRHHDEFLAKKLARMRRMASREACTLTDGPTQPPPADLFEQLKKLGELRDAGVLTEDEFQAKKAQILGRW